MFTLKINETILKFIRTFLQISPNLQGFLSFIVNLTAQSDDVAYIVHFQLPIDEKKKSFYCKTGNNLKQLFFVMVCTVSPLRLRINTVAYSLGGSQYDIVWVSEYTQGYQKKGNYPPSLDNWEYLEGPFTS